MFCQQSDMLGKQTNQQIQKKKIMAIEDHLGRTGAMQGDAGDGGDVSLCFLSASALLATHWDASDEDVPISLLF